MRAPVWGGFYLRNWVVQQSVRMIPWRMIEGTTFQLAVLRVLGARIGQRVYIQRGVDLSRGGWDLLEIGDDVTIGRDAELRLVILDKGEIVIGPVTRGYPCRCGGSRGDGSGLVFECLVITDGGSDNSPRGTMGRHSGKSGRSRA